MGWACSTYEVRNAYKFFVGKPDGKNHSEDLGVDGRVLSELILGKRGGWCGLHSSGSEQEAVFGSCEHGNEPSGFMFSCHSYAMYHGEPKALILADV
jgi:hypothetical protein